MSRLPFIIIWLFSLFSIPLFAEDADIVAFGDHSLWVLANDIKNTFKKDTGISLYLIPEFAIEGKGCAKGILHASGGSPDRDIGLVCCKLNPDIVKKYGIKVYPVVREPLAIIVNKANPVSGLTLKQVKDIFSGRITRWSKVGGPNEPIVVITRLHCTEHIPNWTKILGSPLEFTKRSLNVSSEPDMAKTVSDFKQAIGHLEMTSIAEWGKGVKILSIDGYMPTSKDLIEGHYPFWATLSIVTKGEAKGKAKRFIDYIRTSTNIQKILLKYGMHQTP